MTAQLPTRRFTVYAIKLSPAVLTSRRFRDANPNYVDGMECFYVGMTAKSATERFAQHRSGYKSSGFAKKYGLELMPPSFTIIKLRTFEEASRLERRIAARLRRKGYGVWQN
jgi:predicted GIY-YIG superfamily endonuclease